MATPKASFYTRSISLPSKFHPLDVSIDNHFRSLRDSQAEASSSSSLCQNLSSVKELHENLNELIHLPHNQVFSSREHQRKEFEEVLDGSLVLLDASSFAHLALSQLKESVLDLKSAFRRANNDEGIQEYTMSKKKINKGLSKCLSSLKKAEDSGVLKQQVSDGSATRILKEAEMISLTTLKSLLLYLMGKRVYQTRGWSLVNKLVKSKSLSANLGNTTEVENMDLVLRKNVDTKVVMKQLETLEMVILELGDGLESVSRCFVKTRVSLLNVLNH